MTKYTFLNIPAYGHVNATLAVVQELIARGQQVSYYLTEEFRSSIEKTGATFHPYTSIISSLKPDDGWDLKNALPVRMLDECESVIPQVLESIKAEQTDFIVYDPMCLWAKIVAQSLGIPTIAAKPVYANNEHFNAMNEFRNSPMVRGFTPELFQQLNQKMALLCQMYGVPPLPIMAMFGQVEPLNIIFIPRSFQPEGETFDERFVFVGPSIQPRPDHSNFPLEKLTGQTILYISLGTVFNNQVAFFNQCFTAFKDKPWQVVLAHGKNIDPTVLQDVPANFIIAAHVPQLEVLARATVFLTHAGMNSVMESLYYGVPMVAVPQMPEQMLNARRVQQMGLGISLDKHTITVELLQEAVERILHDQSFRQHALAMQNPVRDAGGYKKAVDAIMHFAHTHQASPSI